MTNDIKDQWWHPTPWPDIVDYCENKYKVLDWYWVSEYDSDLKSLYNYWQKFQGKVFAPNERIMVINHELTYYSNLNDTGLSLYNLFATLHHFDIPSDFLILLVNYPAEREIKELCDLFSLPMPHIVETEHWVDRVRPGITNVPEINIDDIVSPYMCLNGRMRPHRVDMLCMLAEKDLINKGIVTYNFDSEIIPYGPNESSSSVLTPDNIQEKGILYRTTVPFSRNNNLYKKNHALITANINHADTFLYQTKQHPLVDSYENFERFILADDTVPKDANNNNASSYFMQRSGVQLVVESVMEYPYPYFTEKTWKSIMYSRPFILASTPRSLQRIKDFGFKTFHDFWDESYDNIENTSERICAIADIIEKIANLPLLQVKALVEETVPILEHNINIYWERFSKRDLQSVLDQL